MPRGYWCIGLAALLAASTLSAQQAGDTGSGQSSAKQGGHIAQQSPAPIAPAIDRVADELAKTRDDQSDPYGDERNKREERDIIAQEESAKWARLNFLAMVAQTIVAGLALAFLLLDLRQNRKSAEAQLRAYMVVEKFFWNGEVTKESQFGVWWKNSGQTATVRLRTYTDYILTDKPISDDFDFPVDESFVRNGHAGPGAMPFMSTTAPRGSGISYDIMRAVTEGRKYLYVYGWAHYYDAFDSKVERVTKFCCTPKLQAAPDSKPTFVFNINRRHNCSDEGCDDC
jgi:hypothetical protein